ncbi:MAG: HutD family protein, partial [Bdellovibrionaceae bacterium]|nr:HutD family protein [Pseudobdellovibrionaceae bacterium]
LVILRGDGLVLNGTNLQSEKPFKFSGDVPIHCQILGDEVIDLGLIYRRDKLSAKMELLQLSKPEIQYFEPGTHLFFCLSGGLKVNAIKANEGDTVMLEGPYEATLGPLGAKASYVYMKLVE